MEQNSSLKKQKRKEMTVKAVKKKTGMLPSGIDKNTEKLDNIPQEINKIKKALRMCRR